MKKSEFDRLSEVERWDRREVFRQKVENYRKQKGIVVPGPAHDEKQHQQEISVFWEVL